jgi:predicted ATPase
VAARVTRLVRPDLTDLARLLPELAGQVTPPEPLAEAELRHRLRGAIGRALPTAGAPLLLIVDDAQWADAQSLTLIHDLIRSAPSARLLVAATARREELDEHHPLTTLTSALQASGHLTEIGLARLNRADPARLAGHVTGAPLGEAGLGRLYADSEGNPLFVVEALRPDPPAAASKVQAVITGRLARLSRDAAAVTGVAAAVGRAFTADVLAAAAGLDEQAFVAALDELWRRGILRAHGPNAYDFSHGRIRDAAYAALRAGGRDRAGHPLVRAGGRGRPVAARARRRGPRAGARAIPVRAAAGRSRHRRAPAAAADRAPRAAAGPGRLRV